MAEEAIRSRSNPAVKRLRLLKERGHDELALLEGPKLVEEALAAGATLVEAAVTPRARSRPRVVAAVAALERAGVAVRPVEDSVMASLSEAETSQGLLAVARRPAADEERLFHGNPLVLIVAGVQNPGNVGALVRTAEAAGASGAYLPAGTADAFSWKALRGSMGSAFRLPLVKGLEVAEAMARVRARGLMVLAACTDGERSYEDADLRVPVAVLLGGEGAGLLPEWTRAADRRVHIPMRAPVESLNVGVAGALLLFEAARQRRGRDSL